MIKILTVCTGNICRSPYAELYLQNELDRVSPGSFMIRSAGTHALVGSAMDERASMRLNQEGVSSEGFLARQLSSENTSDIDLVLALTEEHRSIIVTGNPRLLKRVYTIREFAALVEEISANPSIELPYGADSTVVDDRWAALVKAAPFSRHAARTKLDGDLDVIDPYRQDEALYDQMVDELLPSLKIVTRFEREYGVTN